ncbi:uncharacterized protein LOC114953673 [Acropora millepora]|uniref:uncharacterized protein LOC114953673 n=1 Tax=Acropora millepora TaxID=45264 RepID=UPI001CF5BBA0|nr:uncharacterized protein LOC114953673 [Acropora millepora]XP_029185828.2 uncharacterized protein LOC114953673 [Acropora millepora]XP_029185829.2 uncharacterized protein LOC114953673 [Acropora millepora]XP_029185830.2 uncharacterized protein LOC114953673 [Acropora millepora]XP_029185831.2 uncharacterized protein LOC114953673 [Acropora millepora]
MATNGNKMHVNGRSRQDEASAPIIDDSLIAEDDEGLPLISAVFSLATNGKPEGTPVSGSQLNVSSALLTSPSRTISLGSAASLNSTSSVKTVTLTGNGAFSTESTIQSQVLRGSTRLRNNMGKGIVSMTTNDTTNATGLAGVAEDSHRRESGRTVPEAGVSSTSSYGGSIMSGQSAGNVLNLVQVVNNASKVDKPQAILPLTTSTVVSNKSPPSVVLPKGSLTHPAKSGPHFPRQIAMKQPSQANKATSIVLQLNGGEPIPKAINLLSPDGKTVMVLTLNEGGRQLVTPSGTPVTGGKILIPLPSSLSVSSAPLPKQTPLVNKIHPIAPLPVKTDALPSQGPSPSPVITSVTGSVKKPLVVSRVVDSTESSAMESVISQAGSRVPGTSVAAAASNNFVSPFLPSPSPNKSELKGHPSSTSDDEKSIGLSPQEAKIQRLKDLIKKQEDAVNKLREKRRVEIERIRDQSLPSKVDDAMLSDNRLKTEIPPLAEQKRPSSPFAVPLPPKKRLKEPDPNLKTVVPKATADPAVTSYDDAFIPNGDDRAFVQLIGLENVVSNIT